MDVAGRSPSTRHRAAPETTPLADGPRAIPASLLLAMDVPERYLSEILQFTLRCALDHVRAVWPVLAFPATILAAAIPWMLTSGVATLPLIPLRLDPPSPRTVLSTVIWAAWAAWFVWSWPRLSRLPRLLAASLASSLPWPVRVAIAFAPGDPVCLPSAEIRRWAQARIDDLGVPTDQSGEVVIPRDLAVSQALIERIVIPASPVTALDHGRVRLASHIAARLASPRATSRAGARFLAYALLIPGPGRASEDAVDCAALSFTDPRLVQRDLEHITRFHGGPPTAARTPEVIALLLRVHQPFLARVVTREQE